MRSYTFKVVLELDKWPNQSDNEAVWRAYIPELRSRGAASWGTTQQEALENLQNAVSLLLGNTCRSKAKRFPTNSARRSRSPMSRR